MTKGYISFKFQWLLFCTNLLLWKMLMYNFAIPPNLFYYDNYILYVSDQFAAVIADNSRWTKFCWWGVTIAIKKYFLTCCHLRSDYIILDIMRFCQRKLSSASSVLQSLLGRTLWIGTKKVHANQAGVGVKWQLCSRKRTTTIDV